MTLLELSAFFARPTSHLWLPRYAAVNPHPQFPVKPRSPVTKATSQKNPKPNPTPDSKPRPEAERETAGEIFPTTIPRKPRRGRRSEAAAVEDFVRDSLERTFAEIRKQNSELLEDEDHLLKPRSGTLERENESERLVEEEDDPDWPADAEVGWGVSASEYFEQHPIRNVVVDGVEIDWEGEMEDGLVKEINCLEWESFAYHPSPLIVLVFERYNRSASSLSKVHFH